MKEQNYRIKLFPITIIFLMLFSLIVVTPGAAKEWSRRGRTEIYGIAQNMGGDSTSSSGIVQMELSSTSAVGLGYGTNFSDHVNLNMDLWLGSTNVEGKAFGVTVNGDTSLLGLDFNIDINILSRRFTPVVTGGAGIINFTGDIEGFPFDEMDLSYNYGAGIRWDATDHLLFKLIYRFTKTQLEETDKAIMLDGPTLSIGYIF